VVWNIKERSNVNYKRCFSVAIVAVMAVWVFTNLNRVAPAPPIFPLLLHASTALARAIK